MARALRVWAALLIVSSAALLSLFWNASVPQHVLAADDELRWYKGNLHTHTLWSDGDHYPEMVAAWYREHDYQFLAFSDHNVLQNTERWTDVARNKGGQRAYERLRSRFPDWIEERMNDGQREVRLRRFPEIEEKLAVPGQFLLLPGEEISDRFNRLPVHMNATNLQELLPPMGGDSITEVIERNMNAVVAQRERTGTPMIAHLNHPNFNYAIRAEDIAPVRAEKFFEVYNGHPGVYNAGDERHASTDRIWDIVLTKRLGELQLPVVYGLATDDGHSYHAIPSRASEPGRGWVMVLASSLTPASLIEALEAGRFYASSGVTLDSVTSSTLGLSVKIKADEGQAYRIEFIGTRRGYDATSKPVVDSDDRPVHTTQLYSDDIGQVFSTVEGTTGEYRFRGDELYVRARVTSTRQHPNPSQPGEFERAWCQPVVGPAVPKAE